MAANGMLWKNNTDSKEHCAGLQQPCKRQKIRVHRQQGKDLSEMRKELLVTQSVILFDL